MRNHFFYEIESTLPCMKISPPKRKTRASYASIGFFDLSSSRASLLNCFGYYSSSCISGQGCVSIDRELLFLVHYFAMYNTCMVNISNLFKRRNYPECQKLFWGVNQGLPAGAIVNAKGMGFIPWSQLEEELNIRAISQCPRLIPPGSRVRLNDFYGKKDWVVEIINSEGSKIGSVWIGSNPLNEWMQDGLVRIGKSLSDEKWEVYQVLERWSDGTYRLVKSI